jgi:hypothetical protein
MKRQTLCTAALAASTLAFGAHAVQVIEVFSEAEAIAGVSGPEFLDTVVVGDDGTAFAVLRLGGSNIVAFDGSSFSTVMTQAQWDATGSTNEITGGNGASLVGNTLKTLNFFDNALYETDVTTGVTTLAVSDLQFNALVGADANFSGFYADAPTGRIFAIETVTDQVVEIAPDNSLSIAIDSADFASLAGGTSVTGIGVMGDKILIGSNSNDSLVAYDSLTDTFATVLTTAEIESVTDDIDGRAGFFGNIFFAPDGLVYFYESDSDYLLSYDPFDPAGTLAAVVTEQEFIDGPSSDTINQLVWYEGQIAFTDQSTGFYTIPEPASLTLVAAGVAVCSLRRRKG